MLLTISLDLISDKIDMPMGPGDEMIVPGDLEGSCIIDNFTIQWEF